MSIIISHPDTNTQKIDKSEFAKEGYLQEYIHKNPESIPVYEIEEDKKLFVVAREFPTDSGSIDIIQCSMINVQCSIIHNDPKS